MKKRALLGLFFLTALIGCTDANREDNNSIVVNNQTQEEIVVEESREYTEELINEEIELVEETDPWIDFLVDEEQIEQLLGNRYDMNYYLYKSSSSQLYSFIDEAHAMFWVCNSSENGVSLFYDSPALCYEKGDLIRYYSKEVEPFPLKLYKVADGTAALPIYHNPALFSYDYHLYERDDNDFYPTKYKQTVTIDVNSWILADKQGNEMDLLDNMSNLDRNTTYVLSYYEGTQYVEKEVNPEWTFYYREGWLDTITNDGEPDAIIEPVLTKEGYAEYDLSSLTPGFYACNGYRGDYGLRGYNVIEIK